MPEDFDFDLAFDFPFDLEGDFVRLDGVECDGVGAEPDAVEGSSMDELDAGGSVMVRGAWGSAFGVDGVGVEDMKEAEEERRKENELVGEPWSEGTKTKHNQQQNKNPEVHEALEQKDMQESESIS